MSGQYTLSDTVGDESAHLSSVQGSSDPMDRRFVPPLEVSCCSS